ncbi:hypothetical protein EJ08DRAFT_306935 [Tothia fuscella]|uniref:Uncharacterized protein n=1 Tax=Tothia fuscella TaxID=1048955 RepID=A0A9P4NP75_9PEZI|nr:hypothetical protein EJ08DRAFT_306935 [Tothia fuscella]
MPIIRGCVTALAKTTAETVFTISLPGRHRRGLESHPKGEGAVPAELRARDSLYSLVKLCYTGGRNRRRWAPSFPYLDGTVSPVPGSTLRDCGNTSLLHGHSIADPDVG